MDITDIYINPELVYQAEDTIEVYVYSDDDAIVPTSEYHDDDGDDDDAVVPK